MNKVLIYMMVWASVLMVGCSRHAYDPDIPAIGFDMEMAGTKALISPSNLNTAGSIIIVNDVHQAEDSLGQYMTGQYLKYNGSKWVFTNAAGGGEIQIPWTKKGEHNFFAYNTYDAASNQNCPVTVGYTSFKGNSSYTAKQQYLQIPSSGDWTLSTNSQFDFIYASATRDVVKDGYAPVPMNFKHLFAAVAVEVHNISTTGLTLEELSFKGIKDKGNAQVAFGGNVTYNNLSTSSDSGLFKEDPNPDITIAAGDSYVLYEGSGNAFLIWPHTATNLKDASIYVKYKHPDTSTPKSIKLTDNSSIKTWEAGNKYIYRIDISDDNISFDVIKVVDWINDDIILEE